MFTNINKKSVKDFVKHKAMIFLFLFPVLYTVLFIMCCPIIKNLSYTESGTVHSEESFNCTQIVDGFYKYKASSAAGEIRVYQDRVRSQQVDKQELTGESLYRNYICEIVSNSYPDLDPDTIAAVVYHESKFQPDAVNKKTNAIGLMQILPKWHTERALKLGVTDLSDPYGNILVGCDILNDLYQQEGSMTYALDFFAGGYKYANKYKNSISPYRDELNQILQEHIFGKE